MTFSSSLITEHLLRSEGVPVLTQSVLTLDVVIFSFPPPLCLFYSSLPHQGDYSQILEPAVFLCCLQFFAYLAPLGISHSSKLTNSSEAPQA